MYTLKKGTPITEAIILDVIRYNDQRHNRYHRLERYYFGKQDILDRIKEGTDINNRVVVNHAKYITDTNTGYLLGNPVEYQVTDGLDIDPILDLYKKQTINDLDSEIAKDCSIFGLQHEYLYANEASEPKSANIDNRNAIIVYDTTLEHNKMFAIMYRPIFEGRRKTPSYYEVVFADDKEVIEYKCNSLSLAEVSRKSHSFGKVPMIEYRNNHDYLGDFETVISLIDAYNILQSDRVNDKEQLVDAILTFYGADVKKVDMEMLRQQRVISGIPSDAKVEYLTKNINETDADVLRQTIEADIHKISMTPNMSDKEFVGNSSGVAIRYKLLAFEQNIKNKERYMERGLMERFEMYVNYLVATSKMSQAISITEVDAVFKRNLPSNDLETSQMIANVKGMIGTETLIGQLSFVKNAKEEADLALKENPPVPSLNDLLKVNQMPDGNAPNPDPTADPNAPVDPNKEDKNKTIPKA